MRRTLLEQNCLVASCGRGLALLMSQGSPLQCGVLHLCTSAFSQHHVYYSLGSRVVILTFWSFSLLLWGTLLHLISSHIAIVREKVVFLLENC